MFLGQRFSPIGTMQLTGSVGVLVLTTGSIGAISGADAAVIAVSGNDVRYRDDGGQPSSSFGVLLKANTTFDFSGNFTNLQFATVGGAATVDIATYKKSG